MQYARVDTKLLGDEGLMCVVVCQAKTNAISLAHGVGYAQITGRLIEIVLYCTQNVSREIA